MAIIYLNGKFLDRHDASLDPLDRGVALGDGIFETIRCEDGQLLFHVAHFARLGRSARLTHLPFSMPPHDLLDVCQQVLDANGLRLARLRITLTRGEPGPSPEIGSGSTTAPTLIVSAAPISQGPLEAQRSRGWSAVTVDFPLNHRSPLAEVKSTSYQEKLLARHQARAASADEGLMLNTEGRIAEGAMSNLFIVRGNMVCTPPVADGALPGIMRLKVGLLCTRLGLEYSEEPLRPEALRRADEAFFTSAVIELMPLVQFDGDPIGPGHPGAVTARLHAEHRRDVDQFLRTMRTG